MSFVTDFASPSCKRFLKIYINDSLHLARKDARIFVRGHYLFREANGFHLSVG